MGLRSRVGQMLARSDNPALGFDEWAGYFSFNGIGYPFMPTLSTMGSNKQEEPAPSFEGYLQAAYKSNGVVFACMLARMMLFSEARFQFRQLRGGRPGDLFGNQALAPLENPWPNGTTGDLLARTIQDADIAGNFYAAIRYVDGRQQIRRMRPDWVTIVLGSDQPPDTTEAELDADVIGYIYHPGGPHSSYEPLPLLVEEVAHFAPIPDPAARFRGMSWLTPIIREFMGDQAMTSHKLKFFENGATINQAVTFDPSVRGDLFDTYVKKFRESHEGLEKAYKTLFLGGGATITAVGADLQQSTFKDLQAIGETRIAAAAGMHPVIVGFSEGLQGSSLNTGNFQAARRLTADKTLRTLWRQAAGAFASIIAVPSGSELYFDDRHIAFLQDDVRDAAELQQKQAFSMKALVEAGYTPDSVVDAVVAGDMRRLVHSGMFSKQLQPPGVPDSGASSNGKPDSEPAALPSGQ
jgi:hypothetical protein